MPGSGPQQIDPVDRSTGEILDLPDAFTAKVRPGTAEKKCILMSGAEGIRASS
jgi:hypothetical protein